MLRGRSQGKLDAMNREAQGWEEKAVLITGGSSGVGKATAKRFLCEGAMVMLVARNRSRLLATTEEFAGLRGNVASMAADVSKVGDCEWAISRTVAEFGRLDVLVNSAGVWLEGDSEESSEEDWDRVIDTNLKGIFFMCAKTIPVLRRTKGCIINVSSDAGIMGLKNAAIYSASKGGVNLLTRSLAVELAEDSIRVNAVCPADILTPMIWREVEGFDRNDREAYFEKLLSQYPQGAQSRFIDPEEVAEMIYYLSSERAEPITGALISMDFGLTAGY